MMNISKKTRRVLALVLLINLMILAKVWHLTVVQKEERSQQAQKPQKRTLVQQANRGSIQDCFHIPLAQNRICYHASVYYGQILQIPSIRYRRSESGKLEKTYPRKEHIYQLSKCMAKALNLDPIYVEDLIHSKASLFPNVPYTIQENIPEEIYYRLRALERDWVGLHAQISAERYYPQGKVASSILGYMGSINSHEYLSIAEEIKKLELFLKTEDFLLPIPEGYKDRYEVYQQYRDLKEKAYTINAQIGKTGIEGQFEKELRGYYGKSSFAVDIRGTFLRELPGVKFSTPGQHVQLAISSELQEFAEQLLAESEATRDNRSIGFDPNLNKRGTLKQPWIKGGAIVAMDPNTGKVLAMASYPRFDPNDFVLPAQGKQDPNQQAAIHKWLETDVHVGRIWDGQEPLTRERFSKKNGFYEEKVDLSWNQYLTFILPEKHTISQILEKLSIREAIALQENMEALLFFSDQKKASILIDTLFDKDQRASHQKLKDPQLPQKHEKELQAIVRKMHPYLQDLSHNGDKLFLIDLSRLAVYSPGFSDTLIEAIGSLSIEAYQNLSKPALQVQAETKSIIQGIFHDHSFKEWRDQNQTAFLKEKRKSEKERNTYARPYLDYLEQKESQLFKEFWRQYGHELTLYFLRGLQDENPLLQTYYEKLKNRKTENPSYQPLRKILGTFSDSLALEFLRTFRKYSELDRPLLGTYTRLRGTTGKQLEKHLAAGFYPKHGFGYGKSQAYRQATPFGSTFKVVVAYEALRQNFHKDSPPFSFKMIDRVFWDSRIGKKGSMVVGYTLDKKPYPRFYKGGRLPRSAHTNMGEIDLMKALEQSSNPFFSILAGDYLKNPEEDLIESAKHFGFGSRTGIDLPGEFRGNLPHDLQRNRTGLYSFAIGQHSLLASPLQSAVFCASFANNGALLKPQIVDKIYGHTPNLSSQLMFDPNEFTYKDDYASIGLNFPLFSQTEINQQMQANTSFDIEVKKWIFLPAEIRQPILEGLNRVVSGEKGTARPSIIRELYRDPTLMKQYKSLVHQMVGKTSTAEILYNPDIHPSSKAKMYKHIWFNALSFKEKPETSQDQWSSPELIITVYLRFGDGGKSGAPLAAQIIHKWREISARESKDGSDSSLSTRSK